VMPVLSRKSLRISLLGGLAASALGALALAAAPENGMAAAVIAVVVGAFGTAVAQPLIDSFLANSIPEADRAKVMSIVYLILYGLSAPFGYVGGLLAGISTRLPLAFVAVSYLGSIALALTLPRKGNAA
jgi:MFS transporter, DHA1 family, tetracycline resistance protein